MHEEQKINPKHREIRQVLRIAGPVAAGLGLLLIAIGFGSFFMSFGLAQGMAGTGKTVPCPKCGHLGDADAEFCDDCGTPLAKACPACGQVNDHDAKFCAKCGSGLTT